MKDKQTHSNIFKILNKNIPIKDQYTDDEIRKIFSSKDYNSGTKRTKQLYIRFFTECANNECINALKADYKISTQKIKRIYELFPTNMKIDFGTFWSSRFRLPKIIGQIVPRNDEKYTEIENFKTYELTPCIAYEMAIRNTKVKLLLKRYEIIISMQNDEIYLYKRFFTKENFNNAINHPIQPLPEEYKNLTFEQYEILIMKKLATYQKLIEDDYKKFIDDYIYKCTELSITELKLLEEKLTDELINDYLIYPTGYQREVPGASTLYEEKILNSKKKKSRRAIDNDTNNEGWQIRYEEIIHDEFIQIQGIHKSNNKYFINNITPNFNRQVNDQNQIMMPINFALPLDEIVEYITIIKKKLNTKTQLELLGKKLNKADDLTNINTTSNKKEKKTLNSTRGKTPQQKLADLFYIYDMKEKGCTNINIIYEINLQKNDKKTAMSDNTLQKYLLIAQDYIKKEKYRELITGKENV